MRTSVSTVLAVVALALWPAIALAAGPEPVKVIDPAPSATAAKPHLELNETQQYCQNIAAAAADARFAWQRKKLNDLDAQLKQRIADLEAKEASLRELMARRDDLMKRAGDNIVGIYSHMKPDAAALQLAALDNDMAASILAQLSQKQASTILNEIPPDRAAKLVTAISTSSMAGKKS